MKVHLVSFDIPFPADYGGAIDVFHKIRSLHLQGVEIYLHCSMYGERRPSQELEKLCKKVWYYPRNTGWKGISLKFPYMVYSRRCKELLQNLQAIEAPILFDGVSTCFYLNAPELNDRWKVVRNQNIEQDYYFQLSRREKNLLKKGYYFLESILLKKYENQLSSANAFCTVAEHDHDFFKQKYPKAVHEYIPSFQPYDHINSSKGKGTFCLYHGNLGLAENREAVLYLLDEIIPQSQIPFIISGRHPDESLKKKMAQTANCTLIENPDMDKMNQLIHEAQIHVLPTFQETGLKLKLLHALFNGRHVLVNPSMVVGTRLEHICHVAQNATEFLNKINNLAETPFQEEELNSRKKILSNHYNNISNAKRLITLLRLKSL